MTPRGFLLLQGSPLEHYPGKKPSGLNEQRLLSEGAALCPSDSLAPGPGPLWKDKADTHNNPTTLSALSSLLLLLLPFKYSSFLGSLSLVRPLAKVCGGHFSLLGTPRPRGPSFTVVSLTKYIKPILIG